MASPVVVAVIVGLGIAAFFYYLYAADGPHEGNYSMSQEGNGPVHERRRSEGVGLQHFHPHESQPFSQIRSRRQISPSYSEMCTICLSTCAIGRKIQLLPCKHEFHLDCLKQWRDLGSSSYNTDQHYLCPNCRSRYINPHSHFQ